jgi:hypothetical protein
MHRKNSGELNLKILEKGDYLTNITQDTLKKELFAAIGSKGVANAVEYCKLNADLITSIYEQENVNTVTRTALKFRNPQNAPDSLERIVLNEYGRLQNNGGPINPSIIINQSGIHYFKPILINNACLVCHGSPGKEINNEVYKQIKNKYPDDLATGFKEGDLRGMWHVVFNEKE